MAKKTSPKKKAAASKKRAAGRAKAKPAVKMKKMAKTRRPAVKAAPRKMVNRRKHRRIATANLWVTELSGDYRFFVPASDISEGGIFLKSRMKTTGSTVSQLMIPMTKGAVLEISAKPVHDVVRGDSYGAGYKFVDLSTAQAKALRGLLRDLD